MSAPPGADVRTAVAVLRRGGLVAFPTETVYGLGADAEQPAALRRLYAVKGRPPAHPVIVHLGSVEQLEDWAASVPGPARTLAAACWPGPLTLVLRRTARVPDEVTGGRDTVGLRVPAAPLALALLGAFGGGVAAPSANRFGHVSPTTADAVRAELGDAVDVVLDGGPCTLGVESTIVDCSGGPPTILRLGGLPRERVEELVGAPVPLRDRGEVAAPGTLERHYAPEIQVVVVEAPDLDAAIAEHSARALRVGLLAERVPARLPAGVVVVGAPPDAAAYARGLYASFREAEQRGLDLLLAVPPPDTGIGAAVRDRLRRASAPGGAGEDGT